jgi:hypothetical protein
MSEALEKKLFYAGLFSLIYVISTLVIFSNTGFDIADEGLHALMSNPNQENNHNIMNYDILFKYLNKAFGITLSLIELRLLRILFVIIG